MFPANGGQLPGVVLTDTAPLQRRRISSRHAATVSASTASETARYPVPHESIQVHPAMMISATRSRR